LAGGHALVAEYAAQGDYAAARGTATLTVNKAPLTLTGATLSMLFGTAPPAPTGTLSGVVAGDGITASWAYSPAVNMFSPVGTYAVVGTLSDPNNRLANYAVTTTNGKLTINRNGTVVNGYTATIGFWANSQGQAMILAEGKTAAGKTLANWLAATYPRLFGASAGANNLTNKSNTDVLNLFLRLFNTPVNAMKLDAQILAVALGVYVTTDSLGGLTKQADGSNLSAANGFTHTAGGLGSLAYDVTTNKAAFGSPANTVMTVNAILAQANANAVGTAAGVTMYGNDAAKQRLALNVFEGINEEGHRL
jgi:hypothetical protein